MSKRGLGKLIAGLGIGAALGVLFAPEKGEETRKKLMEKLDDLYKKAKEIDVDEVKVEVEAKVEAIKEELLDLDKEKVKKIAAEKAEDIKEKIEDLAKLAKEKATPVVQDSVEELRKYAIKATKSVLKKLEEK